MYKCLLLNGMIIKPKRKGGIGGSTFSFCVYSQFTLSLKVPCTCFRNRCILGNLLIWCIVQLARSKRNPSYIKVDGNSIEGILMKKKRRKQLSNPICLSLPSVYHFLSFPSGFGSYALLELQHILFGWLGDKVGRILWKIPNVLWTGRRDYVPVSVLNRIKHFPTETV